jgi:hypothetical protein
VGPKNHPDKPSLGKKIEKWPFQDLKNITVKIEKRFVKVKIL